MRTVVVLLDDGPMLETTQPATPVALRTAGGITDRNLECAATVPASSGALIAANRFFHLATDSESESSTEEIHVPRRRPSRLVLVSQNVSMMEAATDDAPDTHEQRFRRVRHAMQHERRGVQLASDSIRLLAERVGPCDIVDGHPPLMWAAAAGDRSHPVLQ